MILVRLDQNVDSKYEQYGVNTIEGNFPTEEDANETTKDPQRCRRDHERGATPMELSLCGMGRLIPGD